MTTTTTASPAQTSNRLMAPWWRDLAEAKADGKVVKREVKKEIAPHLEQLKHDETYRKAVTDLVGGGDTARLTRGAKKELEAILAANPLVWKEHAAILDEPRFLPGGGARPIDPSQAHGDRVAMRVLFNEGTAVPKTKAWYDRDTLYVQVYGEASAHTRMLTRPKDLEIAVPRPPSFGMFHLVVVDENGAVLKKGADFSGAPRP